MTDAVADNKYKIFDYIDDHPRILAGVTLIIFIILIAVYFGGCDIPGLPKREGARGGKKKKPATDDEEEEMDDLIDMIHDKQKKKKSKKD